MIDKFLPVALLNQSIDTRRRARLFLYAVVITSMASILAALLMLSLNLTQTALTIFFAVLGQVLALVILFASQSVKVASYYLITVLCALVIIDLGPASDFSILALIAVPIIAINLLGMRIGIIWSLAAIVWAIVINPWVKATDEFFTILSYGIGITTAGVAAAAIVVEQARAKAVEEAENATLLAQSQRQRLWMFAEQTFPGIAEVHSGVFEYVNPGLCTLLGRTQEELLSVEASSLIHPDDQAEILNTLIGMSMDGFRIEARVRHGDGHWMWLELYGIPYGTPEEDRWIIATHDYSDIKQSREKLLQAQRLEGVGILAAGIAHDFNNLLTVIMGFGALLPASLERSEILKATQDASELTNQLMAFGQRGPVAATSLDAVHAMENLKILFKSLLGARVKLTFKFDTVPLGIKMNANQFNQIALNLVKNAKESIIDCGSIEISVRELHLSKSEAIPLSLTKGEHVIIKISDTGIGMSEKAVDRAFDPFYSTKQPGEGSGLGLASTYGIVSRHGGSVNLASKPGVGTTITLYFPLVSLEDDSSKVISLKLLNSTQDSLDILVVDDEDNVRNLVCRILENAGHKVSAAGNADEAFAIFEKNPVDLVVSDIVMTGMRGTELVEKLRDQRPELPAVLISGYTGDEVNLWLESDLHTRFLAKPFRGEELLTQINKLSAICATA